MVHSTLEVNKVSYSRVSKYLEDSRRLGRGLWEAQLEIVTTIELPTNCTWFQACSFPESHWCQGDFYSDVAVPVSHSCKEPLKYTPVSNPIKIHCFTKREFGAMSKGCVISCAQEMSLIQMQVPTKARRRTREFWQSYFLISFPFASGSSLPLFLVTR